VAAMLGESPDNAVRNLPVTAKPYWHVERARVGTTRRVPVELIVNGEVAARQEIDADGRLRPIKFRQRVDRSSWIALRILPSSHTNPVWTLVGGKPVRASRRSAEWCLKAVDQCWRQKVGLIRPSELAQAAQAYEYARQAYRQRLAESTGE
jgi:hypothetical protein